MTHSHRFQFLIASTFLLLVGILSINRADAKNSGPNGIVVKANCLALPARTYPVATLSANFFQWEGNAYYFDQHFLPHQVILSGLTSDIDFLLSNYPVISGNLTPLAASDLGLGTGANAHEMVLFSSTLSTYDSLIDIYNVLDTLNLSVMAEPNRFVANPWGIGADPWGIGGDPWGIGADPWGIGSDPWGIGSDPWGIGADALKAQQNGQESRIMPLNQWALKYRTGIGLMDDNGQRSVSYMGDQIDVFVFDTTPYDQAEAYKLYGDHVCNYQASLPVELGAPHDLVKEHGLFSAGLVKMVAPFSDVHLVRTLNEAGFGDVFSTVAVMQDALVEQDLNGKLDTTIFNLSLSVTNFAPNTMPGQQLQNINKRINAIQPRLPYAYRSFVQGNDPIPALHFFTAEARNNGITLVAATGNDSAGVATQPAGLPAAYDTTIGVAASNHGRDLSCFSNEVEKNAPLLAPGGEGYGASCINPFSLGDFRALCGSGLTSPYDCEYTVMSATSTGYGQWLGTSFSTPLVAGATALLEQFAQDIGCHATPDMLKFALVEGASESQHILNIERAFDVLQSIC